MARKLKYNFLSLPSLAGHDDYQSTPGTPDLSITRTTLATMVDADGYIREVQAGEARFTGAKFRHNLAKYSNDFSNAVWTKTNVTLAQDATDPFGVANNAWTLTDDATSGEHNVTQTALHVVNHDGISSVYVKAGTARYVSLGFRVGFHTRWSIFDTTTGAFVIGTGANEVDAVNVESLSDGWYRIAVQGTNFGSNYTQVAVGIANGTASTDTSYSGSGSTIIIYGGMAENTSGTGRTAPSTYIPTTTAAVTSITGPSTTGLKHEEARTNICLQSEDLSTTWLNTNTTDVSNQAVSPDGSTTADLLYPTTTGTLRWIYQASAATSGLTKSIYAKAAGKNFVYADYAGGGTAATQVWFNLSTGAVGTTASGYSGSIEDVGDGWYRCTIMKDVAANSSFAGVWGVSDADGNTTATTSSTDGIYLWGAQCEVGSAPSSYIATTTTSVTRNQDVIDTSDVSWYTQGGPCTLYLHFTPDKASETTSDYWLSLSDDSSSDRIHFLDNTTDRVRAFTAVTGGNAGDISSSVNAFTKGTASRAVIGLATNDMALYVDGTAEGTDTTVDQVSNVTVLDVGAQYGSANPANGHIAELIYWDERFGDSTLAEVSLGDFSNAEEQVYLRKKARDRFRRRYRRT